MRLGVILLGSALFAAPLFAGPVFNFSTGDPDGKIATATRPDIGVFEIESADDFILSSPTSITGATFQGILTGGAMLSDIGQIVVEIYRVFPKDSMDPPSGNVPTRMNSPSDVAFDSRDSAGGTLSATTTLEAASFSVLNSVQPGGIHTMTGGDGAVSGPEVLFNITFTTPFSLPADHYFFVPQVQVTGGDFLWLSAPKPIVPPGTPFLGDLQSWTRDEALDPDWLRVGTDIVDGPSAPTFNATFSLTGEVVPEPATLFMTGTSLLGLLGISRLRRKSR